MCCGFESRFREIGIVQSGRTIEIAGSNPAPILVRSDIGLSLEHITLKKMYHKN